MLPAATWRTQAEQAQCDRWLNTLVAAGQSKLTNRHMELTVRFVQCCISVALPEVNLLGAPLELASTWHDKTLPALQLRQRRGDYNNAVS